MELKICCNDELRPTRGHEGDAGLDLRSTFEVCIQPFECKIVDTGVQMEILPGFFGQVSLRSGFASRNRAIMPNAPGVVDSSYRGRIGVPVINLGDSPLIIQKGERIAQIVIIPFENCDLSFTDGLDKTDRGDGGFGSTGK
jgi:dUTP pyrophosphatase